MKKYLKILILLLLLILGAFALYSARGYFDLDTLGEYEETLKRFASERPIAAIAIAFLIYYIGAFISVPGLSILTVTMGWIFGFRSGLLIVSFASVAGATGLMLFTRYCLKHYIERRFSKLLNRFNDRFGEDCPYCLFTMRLIPGVPFVLSNILPALTKMNGFTFWWVSQLGMLPGTIAYVYAGSSLPSLASLKETGVSGIISPQLVLAFAVLGILPIVIKKITEKFGGSGKDSNSPAAA